VLPKQEKGQNLYQEKQLKQTTKYLTIFLSLC